MNNGNGVNIYNRLFWGWLLISFNIYIGGFNILCPAIGIFIVYSNLIELPLEPWKKKYFMMSAYSAGILSVIELFRAVSDYTAIYWTWISFLSTGAMLAFTIMTIEIVKDSIARWVKDRNVVISKAYSEKNWRYYQKAFTATYSIFMLIIIFADYNEEFLAVGVFVGIVSFILNIIMISSFWNLYKITQNVNVRTSK